MNIKNYKNKSLHHYGYKIYSKKLEFGILFQNLQFVVVDPVLNTTPKKKETWPLFMLNTQRIHSTAAFCIFRVFN